MGSVSDWWRRRTPWSTTAALGTVALGGLALAVWPTQYRYFEGTISSGGHSVKVTYRENRFTGSLDILFPPKGWEKVAQAGEPAAPQTTDFSRTLDIRSALADLSKGETVPEAEFSRVAITEVRVVQATHFSYTDKKVIAQSHGSHEVSCLVSNTLESWSIKQVAADLEVKDSSGATVLKKRVFLKPEEHSAQTGVIPGQVGRFTVSDYFTWPDGGQAVATPTSATGIDVATYRKLLKEQEEIKARKKAEVTSPLQDSK